MDPTKLIVRRAPGPNKSRGLLEFGNYIWPCLLGKNGITTRKREGDWKTPAGSYLLCFALYRKDRVRFVRSGLSIRPIKPDDGWCDAPSDANYNRAVTLPYPTSSETMTRQDHMYDFVVVMDHNYTARIKGRGSAVFFHLTDHKEFTAGCVAVDQSVMKFLLPRLTNKTRMIIHP